MYNSTYLYNTNLQYCLKAAREQVKALESGEKYVRMEKELHRVIEEYERLVKRIRKELEESRRTTIRVRNNWFHVFEDLEKELERERCYFERELKKMEQRALMAEAEVDALRDKVTEQRRELYSVKTELEDEKGKNMKLTAQLNHDFENSSLPSSMSIKKKKISNSREKTGRKPGGQPGHPGHKRKKQTPTEVIQLQPPKEVLEDPDFKKTKRTITKQMVGIKMLLTVTEYRADVYYNSKTGEHIHAKFPEQAIDDVNYDGTVKAFLYLLNNECCVSIDKCSQFLSELTNGNLKISKGMINGLGEEFSNKTKKERGDIIQKIYMSPVAHVDFTNARINGESAQVMVCATPDGDVIYYSRSQKGHKGVKDTLVENYQGILVHDHDTTFYKYGSGHQECLVHILRYLKDSIQNEPERTWNKKMYALLQEMIHYRNSLPDDTVKIDEAVIEEFEKRYRDILQTAKEEYEDVPPSDYYMDGYNLYRRMEKYMENHLLFLHDLRVPADNNESERNLRRYKRKQKQAVSFRSQTSQEDYCDGISVLLMMQKNGENIYNSVSRILD